MYACLSYGTFFVGIWIDVFQEQYLVKVFLKV